MEPERPAGLRVLLGVGGGIAAYKAAELVRELKGRGHRVRCALSRSAEAFLGPLTLEVLSGERLYRQEYLEPGQDGEELHISAAAWAQVLCIAPATAHQLARLAHGLADDFLTTTALAFDGPLVLAPAMHHRMWAHPAVVKNVATLRRRGAAFAGPGVGALASGEVGVGRLEEPAAVARWVEEAGGRTARQDLSGVRLLVTAGPTREALDPVRYLGNRSSGKMGFAVARAAARRGAEVILVAGPVHLETPPGVRRIDVESAREMERDVHRHLPSSHGVVMTAAVADFRPRQAAESKIKKSRLSGAEGSLDLDLVPNPDILAGLRSRAPRTLLVGFAAETAAEAPSELLAEARRKLEAKSIDAVVANVVGRPGSGFGADHNAATVVRRRGEPVDFDRRPKESLAEDLLDLFGEELRARAVAGEGEEPAREADHVVEV